MRVAVTFAALNVALLAVSGVSWAADPTLVARVSLTPDALGPGDRARLRAELDVPEGWHLWGLDPGPGPKPMRITLEGTSLRLDGPWHGPEPHLVHDKGFDRELAQYGAGTVVLEREAVRTGERGDAQLQIRGQICSETTCLDQKLSIPIPLTALSAAAGHVAPPLAGASLSLAAPARSGPRTELERVEAAKKEGLLAFLLFAFLAGLGALATPCVFPAIPMTIAFFSKFSERSFGHAARLSGFYAVSMMGYFTLAGIVVSVLFGASGIQQFAAHPFFNIGLAGLLIFFALNLLGMFEIGAPSWMLNFTNRLEMKFGPAASKGDGGRGVFGDYIAVAVAAATATTVFFTCTVAFVGVVLVAATSGEWFWPTVGMLAFSGAFVLPFFVLALFPKWAERLRGRHGSWLISTRVTLGFLELAAATKFLSNADLVWQTNLLTRDAVLALWVAIFAFCALFLLGKLRLGEGPHDPDDSVSVGRMLAATGMAAFALFLAASLFANRPIGGWVDGWLPPAVLGAHAAPAADGAATGTALRWSYDLEEGRAKARQTGQLVFVNYTGFTCTNCRYMESAVFPLPGIAAQLRAMSLIELYTDGASEAHRRNREDQLRRFKTAALPFYSVERADGTVIATFPSSTNDPEEFRAFLEAAVRDAAQSEAAPPQTAKAPPASTETLRLETTRLSDGHRESAIVQGKWSLVNFWATWCGPCRSELGSYMIDFGKTLEAQGGRFAAIAVEEQALVQEARAFMGKHGAPASSALRLPAEPEQHQLDTRIGFEGSLPFTILVSPEGKVAWRHQGEIQASELRTVVKNLSGIDIPI